MQVESSVRPRRREPDGASSCGRFTKIDLGTHLINQAVKKKQAVFGGEVYDVLPVTSRRVIAEHPQRWHREPLIRSKMRREQVVASTVDRCQAMPKIGPQLTKRQLFAVFGGLGPFDVATKNVLIAVPLGGHATHGPFQTAVEPRHVL